MNSWGEAALAGVLLCIYIHCVQGEPVVAYSLQKLHSDWLAQDAETNAAGCFKTAAGHSLEQQAVGRVLAELEKRGIPVSGLKERESKLVSEGIAGADARWQDLYLDACRQRRLARLVPVLSGANRLFFTESYPLSGTGNIHSTHYLTDEQIVHVKKPPFVAKPGGKLCLLTILPDGSAVYEVLLEQKQGSIRDPALSFDGQTLAFAMRRNFTDDNYKLYQMDLKTREVKPITRDETDNGKRMTCSDVEPCFLPSGRILFSSTRCCQLDPCGYEASGNLYACNLDGSQIVRIGYDQVSTHYSQLLGDGRVLYTRWEYSDRTPIYVQALFSMNQDGTGQTAYYGNNSWFPTSLIHARGIPGTQKAVAIASGHHTMQKGALVLLDRSKGTDGNDGLEFLAGASPDGKPGRQPARVPVPTKHESWIDHFAQKGLQFRYPYPLDENNYLVSFTPDGFQGCATFMPGDPKKETPPFGLYWMDAEGNRELLAFDPATSCGQPLPLAARTPPPVQASQVSPESRTGVFYVKDIYIGPGLKGIPRGTIASMRVVALEFRAAWEGSGGNGGEAGGSCVQTPIGENNCSWDVKHVLGEVAIEKDGSALFEVPARTPVYFQMLDQQGRCVQTMRSWSTLQPGERFACIGCHEDKRLVNPSGGLAQSLAMRHSPQKLRATFGNEHPLLAACSRRGPVTADDELGVQKPRAMNPDAPTDGFSFRQTIQPILERHCVRCHAGVEKPAEKKTAKFNLASTPVDCIREARNIYLTGNNIERRFTRAYLTLTANGRCTPLVNWCSPESRPQMLPPNSFGSVRSGIMEYLEPKHYGVALTDAEKRAFACWIDLCVPFCGSYLEANLWSEGQRAEYNFYQQKRLFFARQSLESGKK